MSKMKLSLATLLLLLPLTAMAAPPSGESIVKNTDLKLLLETIRSNRKALVAANLGLTADEATKFWPIYDNYQKEMNAIGDRIAALVEDYSAHFSDLSNEKALQILEDYWNAEADRMKVRRTYLPEFTKILPGLTVARFFQIENKMDAVIRYDLAATIPVVHEKPQ